MDYNGCKDFLMETAKALLTTDSPSGFTRRAVEVAEGSPGSWAMPSDVPTREGWSLRCPAASAGRRWACAPT